MKKELRENGWQELMRKYFMVSVEISRLITMLTAYTDILYKSPDYKPGLQSCNIEGA